jgi:hypothetical protein
LSRSLVRLAGTTASPQRGTLGVWRGAALYVGSLIGPGVLLVPALAVQVAGPASVIGWALLLLLSAPLAFTFAATTERFRRSPAFRDRASRFRAPPPTLTSVLAVQPCPIGHT